MMGARLDIHADAQNELATMLAAGKIVVHGTLTGNTMLYGSEGGRVIVGGDIGTRGCINAVSNPKGPGLKVFILGTALEYLAESLMGGTVVVMGLERAERGNLVRKRILYPGQSILPGASSGKVVFYDPLGDGLDPGQYAGCNKENLTDEDWKEVSNIINDANNELGLNLEFNTNNETFSGNINGTHVIIDRNSFIKLVPLSSAQRKQKASEEKEQKRKLLREQAEGALAESVTTAEAVEFLTQISNALDPSFSLVYNFLKDFFAEQGDAGNVAHSAEALTDIVLSRVLPVDESTAYDLVREALKRLISKGLVRSVEEDGQQWYSAAQASGKVIEFSDLTGAELDRAITGSL